jgi:hypothetical protein
MTEGVLHLPDHTYRRECARDGYSFRPTTDDWHPCFPEGLVGIVITEPLDARAAIAVGHPVGSCRVVVRGQDDSGMGLDCANLDKARTIVLSLPNIIDRTDLAARGFLSE